MLEGFPREALAHGSDTAGVAMVSCHKSGLFSSFYLFDVVCGVRIPDCGCIFHLRPYKCSVAGVLDFPTACWQVSSQEGSGVFGLLGLGVNVGAPGQRVTEGKTNVLGSLCFS